MAFIAPAALGERRAHMRRDWSDDADRRAIFVKRDDDFPRMQMQHWSVLGFVLGSVLARGRAVDRVAKNGPAHRGTMDAKLMGPAG